MSYISDLVMHRLKDNLTIKMKNTVAQNDLTRASVVKIGRFQEDPIDAGVYIAINAGDPNNPEMLDSNTALRARDRDNLQFGVEGWEVGGGSFWWRSLRIQMGCFYISKPLAEETAQTYAMEVMGRLLDTLEKCYVSDLTDTYGEHAIQLFIYGNTLFESGGPPDQYIWRGTVNVMVLTGRSSPRPGY